MTVLWTDGLIFLLLFAVAAMVFSMRGKEHLKRPLETIKDSSVGMVSLTVLLFFVAIGLLDSVHFKSAGQGAEIISVLDYVATPLREHGEKTYSAPFATTLYNKEMVTLADGSTVWDYPRLQFGGQHLTDGESVVWDVLLKGLTGFGLGVLVFLCCAVPMCLREDAGVSSGALQHWSVATMRARLFKPVPCTLLVLLTLSAMLIYLSGFYHVLGTDKVGEDVFYQAVKSIRTGLVIGTLTTLVMLPMAVLFGILAGYFRGWVDDIIQYIYTTLNSIPSVLLIAASILMVQVYMANHEADFTSVVVRSDTRLLFLCLILGVTSWTGLCRLLRAETLKLREMEYVQAAHALGVKQHTILLRHILPNVMHIVLISVVLDFSSLVLAEAVLSYINIGVDPTTYSWGNMINGARLEMAREPIVWWSLSAAFVFMFALVLAANLFADTVQDAFDPRRGAQGNV